VAEIVKRLDAELKLDAEQKRQLLRIGGRNAHQAAAEPGEGFSRRSIARLGDAEGKVAGDSFTRIRWRNSTSWCIGTGEKWRAKEGAAESAGIAGAGRAPSLAKETVSR